MVFAIVLFSIFFAFGMVFPKSKAVAFSMLIFLWVFYAFNTFSGDYEVYRVFYEEVSLTYLFLHFESGFSSLMAIFRLMSLPFLAFKIGLGALFVILLHIAIRLYTDREAMVLSVFMIFPFMYYASVLRAGIAMLLITISIHFLLDSSKKGLIKYIVFITLTALLFHYSSLILLLLIFARKGNIKNSFMIAIVFAIILAILMYTNALYHLADIFIDNTEILEWLLVSSSNGGLNYKGRLAQIVILTLIVSLITRLNYKHVHQLEYNNLTRLPLYESKLLKVVCHSNILLLTLIPLLMITDVWMRIVWSLVLIDIIVCVNSFSIKRISFAKRIVVVQRKPLFVTAMFAFVVLCLLYSNYPYFNTPISFENYFRNNLVFQLFPF